MELDAHRRAAVGAVGAVSTRERGELQAFTCSSCGVEPVGLRPGICRGCERRQSAVELEERRAERLMIPPRFRWARMDLAPFTWRAGAPAANPSAVAHVRAFRGHWLTLRGETGSWKSSFAAAWLMARAAEGMSALWVQAELLPPDAPDQDLAARLISLAVVTRAVVIDDVGKDLGTAPVQGEKTGLAAYRAAPMQRLLRALHLLQGTQFAQYVCLTVDMEDHLMAAAYGGDVVRRAIPGCDTPTMDALELTLRGPV